MKRILSALALLTSMLAATTPATADIVVYRATMSGPGEVIPNASPGAGIATITIDDVAHTMQLQVPFSDLVGSTTAAYLHCCTFVPLMGTGIAAAGLPAFPLGVREGNYSATLDLLDPATYDPYFIAVFGGTVASAEAALLMRIAEQDAYLNIYTTAYPFGQRTAGEIRGFLVPLLAPIPEPGSWAMLLSGLAALCMLARKRA